MTTEQTESTLSEIARVELTHVDELKRVRETCDTLIADARHEVERVLAGIPAQCQAERKAYVDGIRAEAEVQASEIRSQAAEHADQLETALDGLTDYIVEEIFHMMLPEPETADRSAGEPA
jgi:vacuolar-type H+-ATPase subunit H